MVDETKPNGATEPEIVKFSEGSGFDYSMFFVWVTVILAVGATVVFWVANGNVKSAIKERGSEKDSITAEINGKSYSSVEDKATGFKAAVTALKQAKNERYSYTEFLPEFYKKITNDVKLNSFSISETGELSMDGTTSSYRSVAELVLALKSWPTLTDIKLGSVSYVSSGNAASAAFSLTAKIDKTLAKKVAEISATTDTASPADADTSSTATTDTATTDTTTSADDSGVSEPSITAVGE